MGTIRGQNQNTEGCLLPGPASTLGLATSLVQHTHLWGQFRIATGGTEERKGLYAGTVREGFKE